MEIVIVAGGMPFGPDTLKYHSLGGSETAAMHMAKELRKKKHIVSLFCNLPPANREDHIESGFQGEDGVRYVTLEHYPSFIMNTEVDLLIASRDPGFINISHQAKFAVLWCHDLATYNGFTPKFMEVAWNINEVWCVSEFHRQQFHKVVGYPLERIKATRNGIVHFDTLDLPPKRKSLMFSARPERGLEILVRPGGIMERLPDFTLDVTMYENYPEHMMEFYRKLWSYCDKLPNVNVLGPKKQHELRQMMAQCWAYVYPTEFEEVSCILAREAMEQGLPYITTKIGALPETLGNTAQYVAGKKGEIYTDKFAKKFASAVRSLYKNEKRYKNLVSKCKARTDLYWSDVADDWMKWAKPKKPIDYSLILSLIKDSDIIPAMAVMGRVKTMTPGLKWLKNELDTKYKFVTGEVSMAAHYKGIYELEESKGVPERQKMITLKGSARYEEIASAVRNYENCKKIIEYGCAEGPIIFALAQDFPDRQFIGIDIVPENIALCKKYARKARIKNVEFYVGSTDDWPESVAEVDMAIIAEVLEHTVEPWKVLGDLEKRVKMGGNMIITVPQGPWEWSGLKKLIQWGWRAHIWHIDKWMIREMLSKKDGCFMNSIIETMGSDGRSWGHIVSGYLVDHKELGSIDPIEKSEHHRCRDSLAICMIAMDEEDQIIRTFNSIEREADQIQIALGPCSDRTKEYIENWKYEHPWIEMRIKDVQKIEPNKFGFDDARNASMKDIESDWVLWIDADEYTSGDTMRSYLKDNAFDSYAIHQHHFSCQPRGEPAQLDKPARLIRNNGKFTFYGKVHEHAELGFNGGPGFVMVLPDIDIGHIGYVNEAVRISRFARNYPLLEWDRKVYPERTLGRYLWLRDIIHRMRMYHSRGDTQRARLLAEEGLQFYKEYSESFSGVGAGGIAGNHALNYYSETLKYLGLGFEITVQLGLEGNNAGYTGVFENGEEATKIAIKAINSEIEKRSSGYWK